MYYSSGALYLHEETIYSLGLQATSLPFGLFSHLFIHVGAQHLLSNIIPLVIFAFVLESVATAFDVALVFFLSGVAASLVFSILNPGVALVGSSAGVSGIMGAAALVKPRVSIPLLFLAPFIAYTLAFPLLNAFVEGQERQLQEKQEFLEQRVEVLVAENKTQEAFQASEELAQVVEEKHVLERGIERERTAQSDFLVHVLGAFVGVLYILVRKRELLANGRKEFLSLLRDVRNALKAWKGKK